MPAKTKMSDTSTHSIGHGLMISIYVEKYLMARRVGKPRCQSTDTHRWPEQGKHPKQLQKHGWETLTPALPYTLQEIKCW